MTYGDIEEEVFRRLREASSSPVMWSADDVKGAVNAGYAEVSDETEWYERSVLVDLLQYRPYYDFRFVTHYPVLSIGPAFNVTTNRWLIPVTPRELADNNHQWEKRYAEPEFILVRSMWFVSYWPWKASSEGSIKQYYTSLPQTLCASGATPGFPEAFHYGLVEYALSELWAQDGEVDLSWAAWKEYERYEAKLRAWVDEREKSMSVRGMRE